MNFSKIFAVFVFLLIQHPTKPQQHQQQQQNVVEQSSATSTAESTASPSQQNQQPLTELHNTFNKFLYHLKQTGEKVVAQPPQHPPLLFTGGSMGQQPPQQQRHSGADVTSGSTPYVRPFIPLGHVPPFPSSLLVPTPAHLPSTFRLPATVMEQHKAFPMEGLPPHPMVLLSSMNNEQHTKRHKISAGTEAENSDGNNGTTEVLSTTVVTVVATPLLNLSQTTADQDTVSDVTTVTELENTVHNEITTASDAEVNDSQQQNVVAVVPPLAVPIEMATAYDTTPNVTTEGVPFAASPAQDRPLNLETTVTEQTISTALDKDDYGSQTSHIFFVPGGVKSVDSNGSRHALTAVDLEAFLRSANVARILATWNNSSSSNNNNNNNNNQNNNTMSSQNTKLFLALVERVLEQEVARRLDEQQLLRNGNNDDNKTQRMSQSQTNRPPNIVLPTDEAQKVVEAVVQHQGDKNNNNNDDDLERDLEERLLDSQKLLKTANTRLFSMASNEAEAAAALVPVGLRDDGAVPGVHHQHQQQQAAPAAHQKGVINLRRGNTATSTSSSAAAESANQQRSVVHEIDYKQREQAEFDRLLDRLRAEESIADGAELSRKSAGKAATEDTDLLLIVPSRSADTLNAKWPLHGVSDKKNNSSTTAVMMPSTTAQLATTAPTPTGVAPKTAAFVQHQSGTTDGTSTSSGMMLNRQHQFWSRHGPKTKFERLVEDYRWRLTGQDSQNGLNDLIKALRNSNIGFFDRLSSPSTLKILRRVD